MPRKPSTNGSIVNQISIIKSSKVLRTKGKRPIVPTILTFTFSKASFRDSKIFDLRVVSIYTEKELRFTNHFDL